MNEFAPEAREMKVTDIQLNSKNISVTPYGVEFVSSPSIEEWKTAVLAVQKVHGMTQFYLGDLIVYAESPVTGWGETKYADLVDATGYENNTLRRFASVARRFSPKFREEIAKRVDTYPHVSFGHFQLVTSLDDNYAGYFLEKAAENRWGVARLREELARELYEESEERQVEEWRGELKAALTRIKNSEPQIIEIRSIRDGEVIATETIEIG
jgi:hypothetical protein